MHLHELIRPPSIFRESSRSDILFRRQRAWLRRLAAVFFLSVGVAVIAGCSSPAPCGSEGGVSADTPGPPSACRVDGCSVAPDFNFASCCNDHDARYWRGGSAEQRASADASFGQCLAAKNHRILARLYYLGVRVGGTPYLPTPWRWGFGWPYTHGYAAEAPGAVGGVPAAEREVPASVHVEPVAVDGEPVEP